MSLELLNVVITHGSTVLGSTAMGNLSNPTQKLRVPSDASMQVLVQYRCSSALHELEIVQRLHVGSLDIRSRSSMVGEVSAPFVHNYPLPLFEVAALKYVVRVVVVRLAITLL
jgi:hypothetical protein